MTIMARPFGRSIARLSEGLCPLCSGRLIRVQDLEPDTRPLLDMTEEEFDRALELATGFGRCDRCKVSWALQGEDPDPDEIADPELHIFGDGPYIIPTRELTDEEILILLGTSDERTEG